MTTIELTRFTTTAERADELLAARPAMLRDFHADRTGFLGARLVRLPAAASGSVEWLDIVEWRTADDFAESRAKGGNLPGIQAFFAAIERLVSAEQGESAA